jgi:hypothetical protein
VSYKWNKGSAVPQNKIPTASVVVNVTETQLQKGNIGFDPLPPMTILPSGDSAAQMHVTKKKKAAKLNMLEKASSILSLTKVVIPKNLTSLKILKKTKVKKTINGGQNTKGLTDNFLMKFWIIYHSFCFNNNTETLMI